MIKWSMKTNKFNGQGFLMNIENWINLWHCSCMEMKRVRVSPGQGKEAQSLCLISGPVQYLSFNHCPPSPAGMHKEINQ